LIFAMQAFMELMVTGGADCLNIQHRHPNPHLQVSGSFRLWKHCCNIRTSRCAGLRRAFWGPQPPNQHSYCC
jgi:hypothetical protein